MKRRGTIRSLHFVILAASGTRSHCLQGAALHEARLDVCVCVQVWKAEASEVLGHTSRRAAMAILTWPLRCKKKEFMAKNSCKN